MVKLDVLAGRDVAPAERSVLFGNVGECIELVRVPTKGSLMAHLRPVAVVRRRLVVAETQ
jgi:hypothetical protein